MKTKTCTLFTLLILIFTSFLGYSQMSNNWSLQWNYPKAFIENKGQFDGRDKLQNSEILYAIDHGSLQIFFTKKGITYRIDDKIKNKNRKKGQKPKLLVKSDYVYMNWVNANPDVQIITEELLPDYHTYSMLSDDRESYYDIRNIKGFKKLTYKNLYPAIDVEYVFHPSDGIKYSVILHPGADISKFGMQYEQNRNIFIDNNGMLKINTLYGDITEHTPLTFYADNNQKINSGFNMSDNRIGFSLDNFNNTKKIIIDPWVQTPTLANSNGVWELDKDAAGNIYIIGGDMPMKLQKYNSSGALQWTYNTPWDTANFWLGTLTSDMNGNSYIAAGSSARIQKVDNAGSMVWSANGGAMDEYWMITFNCDHTKLIVGGTRLNPVVIANSNGVIFDIDINSGNVLTVVNVAQSRTYQLMGMPVTEPNEVRALSSSRDAKYFYLTLDTIGAINDNMNLCSSNAPVFAIPSSYNFSYKSEDYRPNNGNAGIRAIRANKDFVYTQNGSTIHKRNLADGSIITSAPITGGITNSVSMTPFIQPGNNGIAVDSCGNVYVGSGDRVIKFDADLNVLSETLLPFAVFDVVVSNGGNVVVCGATGNSSSASRTGYVQSINMSACDPFQLVCCNTAICPVGPFCPGDAPVTLVTETPGGTWSGPGVDANGVFTPTNAGIGTHTITYSLPCGSSSIVITINACAQLSACVNTNGNIVVSGGTAPYTWQEWQAASSTPITNATECTACGYTWNGLLNQCLNGLVPVTTCNTPAQWVNFATGDTITPPLAYPIKALDANGDNIVINDFASLQPCAICSTYTLATAAVTNATCPGGTNGSFTAEAYGGNGPYTYTLILGGTTVVTYPNVSGSQDFTGLGAGTYTVNVFDSDNCPATTTVTIGEDPFNVSATSNTPVCEGATINFNASGGTVYAWSGPNGFTSNVQNPVILGATLAMAGDYTVTVSVPPCSDTVMLNLVVNPSPVADAGTDQSIYAGETVTLNASGGQTYAWSPANNLSDPNSPNPVASPVNTTVYTVTVTNSFGCSSTDNVTITVELGELFIPNIFAPNSANQNNNHVQVYGINDASIKEITFFIYNRWGEKVFEATTASDAVSGWDGNFKGKPCDAGVYVYYLDLTYVNDEEVKISGNVTLVR